MRAAYRAVLRGNQLEWHDERPEEVSRDREVEVSVTLLKGSDSPARLRRLEPAGEQPSDTPSHADRVNAERLQLLARRHGKVDLSLEEEARLADLTRRVERLLPRVTAQDWERLEKMISQAEDFRRRVAEIQQRHGLAEES